MTGHEALQTILPVLGKTPAAIATGYLSRAAHEVADRPENFYIIGSMGMAASIATGLALARPSRRVAALDGDGAVLMNLGALANIGALGLENLLHIVIDNERYESTGGQPSVSRQIRLDAIARASGYRQVARVRSKPSLLKALKRMLRVPGPAFLLVKVSAAGTRDAAPRVRHEPEAITRRFQGCLR